MISLLFYYLRSHSITITIFLSSFTSVEWIRVVFAMTLLLDNATNLAGLSVVPLP